MSEPVHYDIKFETETYRSGRKHIKKTRYKENPYGKIIGKNGKRAQAIRSIMKAKYLKEGKRVIVDIVG